MDPVRSQDTLDGKGPSLRYRDHSDESPNMHQTDNAVAPGQDDRRPIRRVRSPSRPRAWLSQTYKSKFTGHFYKPHLSRDNRPFYKPGPNSQRYHHPFNQRPYFHKRNYFQPKLHHAAPRQWDHDREKEWYEPREATDASSPPKQNSAPRPFSSRSTSSRDKDMPFTAGQSDRNQSRERDHRGSKSKDRERSRDGELPSTVSQTAARDRAIQQKRREIDEVYYQECEMFGLVTKMLIEKDPSLEQPIQSSLQENLRDIGKRCVEAMQKFIEDYDSKELLH